MSLSVLLCSALMTISLPRAEYACRNMDILVEEAQKNDIEPEVLIALIHEESRWKPHAESSAGACGLTQVIPKYTKPYVTCRNLKRSKISLREGAKALSYWVYEYGKGDYKKGLCGYNGGYKCGKNSKNYARRVMRLAAKINKQVATQRAYQSILKDLNLQIDINDMMPKKE